MNKEKLKLFRKLLKFYRDTIVSAYCYGGISGEEEYEIILEMGTIPFIPNGFLKNCTFNTVTTTDIGLNPTIEF